MRCVRYRGVRDSRLSTGRNAVCVTEQSDHLPPRLNEPPCNAAVCARPSAAYRPTGRCTTAIEQGRVHLPRMVRGAVRLVGTRSIGERECRGVLAQSGCRVGVTESGLLGLGLEGSGLARRGTWPRCAEGGAASRLRSPDKHQRACKPEKSGRTRQHANPDSAHHRRGCTRTTRIPYRPYLQEK